jgi:PAS domain S-box-containing protein/putative nucleotidyltransferase with HDIG domain
MIESHELRKRILELEALEVHHKRAEEALRNSENRYRFLVDNTKEIVLIVNKRGKIIFVNKNTLINYGYSKEELIGKSITHFLTRDCIKKVLYALIQEFLGHSQPEIEVRAKTKAGEIRYLRIAEGSVPIYDNERLTGVMVSASDITEHKKAEEALRKNEKLFKELWDNAPVAYHTLDTKGIITRVNQTEAKMLGYTKEEMIGKSILEFILPEQRTEAQRRFQQKIIGHSIPGAENRIYVRKDGSKIHVDINDVVEKDRDGKAISVRTTMVDVTERKRAEEALRESEKRYRNLFDNVPVGLYRTTPAGECLDANPALVQMLGYLARESLLTINVSSDYLNPEDRERWETVMEKNGVVEDFEIQVRRRDGKIIWVKDSARAIMDKEGCVLCYEGAWVDFTGRKKAEEELSYTIEILRKNMGATIQAISRLVEMRDPYTAGHQRRVADLARAIAKEMGLLQEQVDGIRMAGLIHDIGKVSVPAEILSKPGRLGEIEFNMIKIHSQYGYEILKPVEFPQPIAQAILQHHERIDGSGYPLGLSDKEILIEAKILAVADVVEAIISHRPYRPAHSLNQALEEIPKNSGVLYDPKVIETCLSLFVEKGFKFREEKNPTISPN